MGRMEDQLILKGIDRKIQIVLKLYMADGDECKPVNERL